MVIKSKLRRSKLYYLRQRSGKSARIAEKKDIIKKTNQTVTEGKIIKNQTEKGSLTDKETTNKSSENPKKEAHKENKKDSK